MIGCSIELIWTPKSKSNTSTPKNQLADILTKGNFTRDEWNHLLTLFNISHFSSTACTAAMAKRAQQGSGEERVHSQIATHDEFDREDAFGRVFFNFIKAGGGPRMDIKILENLLQVTIDRGNLRNRHHQVIQKRIMVNLILVFSKSGKVELRSTIDQGNLRKLLGIYCKKMPLTHREEPLLVGGSAHSARYGEMIHDGSGKPETLNHQEEANSENFVIGSDAAEFVDKVKDQVRNRQKRMSNVAESGEEHSIISAMFMAATLNAATFMGKNFSTIQSFFKNYEDLTLKQMFDVTAQFGK